MALLEPTDMMRKLEVSGDCSGRLALQESLKMMPTSAVLDYYCLHQGVPAGFSFMDEIHQHEKRELAWHA
jgi:L-rhamnose isomerase